jgi:hypothetical protein
VDVKWIATDPDSQRLSFVERRTSADDYIARIEALLAVGEGYSEVQWADRAVRGGYGVVHLFSADGELFILAGDGVIDASETVLIPVLDDGQGTPFTGEYVLSAEHAWKAVKHFVRHGAVEDLGNWQEL